MPPSIPPSYEALSPLFFAHKDIVETSDSSLPPSRPLSLPPPQEGFHDLRQATDERYMVFRRTFYQAERAAAAETAATDKRRRQQWMLVSACLLGLWIVSSLVRTISGGGGGRWEGRAGGEGAVEGMQWNVTQAGGEREGRGGGGFSIWGGKSPADVSAFSYYSSPFPSSCSSHPLTSPFPPSLSSTPSRPAWRRRRQLWCRRSTK